MGIYKRKQEAKKEGEKTRFFPFFFLCHFLGRGRGLERVFFLLTFLFSFINSHLRFQLRERQYFWHICFIRQPLKLKATAAKSQQPKAIRFFDNCACSF